MNINWYKYALQKHAMAPNLLFEFYALQSLSEEVLKQHPEMLFRLTEVINYLRRYYLSYLFRDMADELYHYWHNVEVLWDRYDWPNDRTGEQEHQFVQSLMNSLKEVSAHFHDEAHFYNEAEPREEVVLDLQTQQAILKIFNFPYWEQYFGGPKWAESAQWTFRLYNMGEIPQAYYSSVLMQKIKEGILALDTIHSLEHNTKGVLSGLPEREGYWMSNALDAVFEAEHPVYLADISGNRELSKLYRREVNPLESQRLFESNIRDTNQIIKKLHQYYGGSADDRAFGDAIPALDEPYGVEVGLEAGQLSPQDIFNNIDTISDYVVKTKNGILAYNTLNSMDEYNFISQVAPNVIEELWRTAIQFGSRSTLIDLGRLSFVDETIYSAIVDEMFERIDSGQMSFAGSLTQVMISFLYNTADAPADFEKLMLYIERLGDAHAALLLSESNNVLPSHEREDALHRMQNVIINSHDAEAALKFAEAWGRSDFADIEGLQKVVGQYGDVHDIYDFAQKIPNADIAYLWKMMQQVRDASDVSRIQTFKENFIDNPENEFRTNITGET